MIVMTRRVPPRMLCNEHEGGKDPLKKNTLLSVSHPVGLAFFQSCFFTEESFFSCNGECCLSASFCSSFFNNDEAAYMHLLGNAPESK